MHYSVASPDVHRCLNPPGTDLCPSCRGRLTLQHGATGVPNLLVRAEIPRASYGKTYIGTNKNNTNQDPCNSTSCAPGLSWFIDVHPQFIWWIAWYEGFFRKNPCLYNSLPSFCTPDLDRLGCGEVCPGKCWRLQARTSSQSPSVKFNTTSKCHRHNIFQGI